MGKEHPQKHGMKTDLYSWDLCVENEGDSTLFERFVTRYIFRQRTHTESVYKRPIMHFHRKIVTSQIYIETLFKNRRKDEHFGFVLLIGGCVLGGVMLPEANNCRQGKNILSLSTFTMMHLHPPLRGISCITKHCSRIETLLEV